MTAARALAGTIQFAPSTAGAWWTALRGPGLGRSVHQVGMSWDTAAVFPDPGWPRKAHPRATGESPARFAARRRMVAALRRRARRAGVHPSRRVQLRQSIHLPHVHVTAAPSGLAYTATPEVAG